jgi:hypothetical protein
MIPRGENTEADEITKHASHRLAQSVDVFEERLFKPSATPPSSVLEPSLTLPPPPEQGSSDCGPPLGDRLLLALARQEGVDWILELKAYLISGKLPEEESEVERITCQATGYCIKDGDLYQCRPSGIALKCISTVEGQELLRDIHVGECGQHSSVGTTEMVRRCEACQFHAKQIHQPMHGLQTIPLTWTFSI